jgi:predicted permease
MTHLSRILLRTPSFFLLVASTLGLAVGANLVVFTVVSGLWFRSTPVADPSRLVLISNLSVHGGEMIDLVRYSELQRFAAVPSFRAIAGQVTSAGLMSHFRPSVTLNVAGDVETAAVTPSYFSVLGLSVFGQDFRESDDQIGTPMVAIIGYDLWKSAFGGDPGVIGSFQESSRGQIQVIGIAPENFQGARLGERFEMWVPRSHVLGLGSLANSPTATSASAVNLLPMIGLARLQTDALDPGLAMSLGQSSGRGPFVVHQIGNVYGSIDRATTVIREGLMLRACTVAAVLVLVTGCVNLATLLLARFESRRTEFATRLAVGGTPRNVVAMLVRELVVLAGAGVLVALALAHWLISVLPPLTLPGGIDLSRLDLSIDTRTAVLSAILSAGVVGLAGLFQAIRYSRALDVASVLKTGSSPERSALAQRWFLAFHCAVAVAILVVAGLLVRSITFAYGQGAGFDIDRTLIVSVTPGISEQVRFRDSALGPTRKMEAYSRLLDGVKSVPGVSGAALGRSPVAQSGGLSAEAKVVRFVVSGTERTIAVGWLVGGEGYVSALGLQVLVGRVLAAQDIATRNVLITSSLFSTLFPGQSTLGQQFSVLGNPNGPVVYTVVGVTPDFPQGDFRSGSRAGVIAVGAPEELVQGTIASLVLSTASDNGSIREGVIKSVAEVFPRATAVRVEWGRHIVAELIGRERLALSFFGGFGFVSLFLSCTGFYGLVSLLVASRRRDFGVRLALGASSRDLIRHAVLLSMQPVLVGTIGGVLLAGLAAAVLRALVHGVSPWDPLTYVAAPAIALTLVLFCGIAGARRLSSYSPLDAIRR